MQPQYYSGIYIPYLHGGKIRDARLEVGSSQEELAEKVYLRRPTLSDIENGKSEPNASTLGLFAFYLKKPLS